MKNRVLSLITGIFLVLLITTTSFAAKPLVLFDEGHAQRAGNADWVITGAYSDFANAFKKEGCQVKSITKFTSAALKEARIVVLPEPNSAYSEAEQNAIVNFVNNGGCLYAISDHNHSDRNGDGIDSVGVLNQFVPKLGLSFNKKYFTEAPVSGTYAKTEITTGVSRVGIWGGTTVQCVASTAKAHIKVSSKNGSGAFIATNIVGSKGGKVVAMGDSSPYDDGSGNPHDKLYNGYNNPQYQHDKLAHNSIKWLLKKESKSNRSRMRSIMRNIEANNTELKSSPNNSLYLFTENSENNLLNLLDSDKTIQKEFSSITAENPTFKNINRQIKIKATFEKIHNSN